MSTAGSRASGSAPAPTRVSFRPLREEDLPRLVGWMNTPHVLEWWDKDMTLERVRAKYLPLIRGEEPTWGFLIRYEERPIGYIQHYRVADHPEYASALALGEDAVAVDLYIGDEDLVHRGLGAPIVRRFFLEVALPAHGLEVAVICPSIRNRAAIRAYEKAGFRYLKTATVPNEDDPEHVMRATRADLAAG